MTGAVQTCPTSSLLAEHPGRTRLAAYSTATEARGRGSRSYASCWRLRFFGSARYLSRPLAPASFPARRRLRWKKASMTNSGLVFDIGANTGQDTAALRARGLCRAEQK
jgi:hypothetical protein